MQNWASRWGHTAKPSKSQCEASRGTAGGWFAGEFQPVLFESVLLMLFLGAPRHYSPTYTECMTFACPVPGWLTLKQVEHDVEPECSNSLPLYGDC